MFRTGQQIGSYTLVERLGRGAFGEVWLAERRAKFVTTKVAVKLPLDEQVEHDAIKQEASVWEQASGHPNVLPIIDADEYDGQIVIVSEYAPDGSLEDLLKKNGGSLPMKQAVEMTIGILSGLEFLHSRKIIHRDIKPANILLQGETPRLADFGISRVMKTNSMSANLTGTPYYMAPEAFDKKRNVQTDIWSVGVVLYQMLKGELPFTGENITDLLGAIITGNPELLPSLIPPALQKIVLKSLAKQPAERYQSTREMREDLTNFLVGISQQNLLPTYQAERLPETLPILQLAPTQASPTVKNFVPTKNTDEQRLGATKHPNEILEIPEIKAQNPTTRFHYLKILAPVSVLLLLLTVGGLYLLINKTNSSANEKISATSNNIELFPYHIGSQFGFKNSTNKLVIEAKFDMVKPFSEGLAAAELNGRWGFIDSKGKEVIPFWYDSASSFQNGVSIVSKDYRFGLIDKNGKELIPFKYKYLNDFSDEGLATADFEGKQGVIDKNDNIVIPFKYENAYPFSEGLICLQFNDKWSFYDRNLKEVTTLKNYIGTFKEGLLATYNYENPGSKSGFLDKNGNTVIPFKYESAANFSEGMAAVRFLDSGNNSPKWGYIDKNANLVVTPDYIEAKFFKEGLAPVKLLRGKWGYIDKNGSRITQFKYDEANQFQNGFALVRYGGNYVYIDRKGVELYEP